MPFSEILAARTRDALARRTDIAEQRMFGGICFLLRGNILVGVRRDSLLARLGEEEAARALKKPFVTQFGAPRRPMKGWVVIDPEGLDTDRQLASWVEKAVAFVETMDPK